MSTFFVTFGPAHPLCNDGDELKAGKFDGLKDEREIKSFRPMDQPSANFPKRVDSQN